MLFNLRSNDLVINCIMMLNTKVLTFLSEVLLSM